MEDVFKQLCAVGSRGFLRSENPSRRHGCSEDLHLEDEAGEEDQAESSLGEHVEMASRAFQPEITFVLSGPLPQWFRLKTGTKIRYNKFRRHWRRGKIGV